MENQAQDSVGGGTDLQRKMNSSPGGSVVPESGP